MAREGMRKRRGQSQSRDSDNGASQLAMKSAFLTVRIVGTLIILYAAWSFFLIFSTDSRRALVSIAAAAALSPACVTVVVLNSTLTSH